MRAWPAILLFLPACDTESDNCTTSEADCIPEVAEDCMSYFSVDNGFEVGRPAAVEGLVATCETFGTPDCDEAMLIPPDAAVCITQLEYPAVADDSPLFLGYTYGRPTWSVHTMNAGTEIDEVVIDAVFGDILAASVWSNSSSG